MDAFEYDPAKDAANTRRGAVIRLISCHRADGRWERIYEAFIGEKIH